MDGTLHLEHETENAELPIGVMRRTNTVPVNRVCKETSFACADAAALLLQTAAAAVAGTQPDCSPVTTQQQGQRMLH